MHPSFISLGFAFPGLLELVILVAVCCFVLGTWRVKVIFNHVRWFLSDLRGDDEKARAAERRIGLILREKLLKETPKTSDIQQINLLQRIRARLIRDIRWNEGDQPEFEFQVVESKRPNACAIPGGFIFVSDSLIEFCERKEDELTFVLAHEMAHVLCGHAKNHILANVLLSRLAGLAVRGSIPGLFAGGALTRLLSDVFDKAYSRKLELDADTEAVGLLQQAGRDVQAAIRLLQRLKEIHGDDPLMSYFSTHPTPEERIANIQRIVRKIR